MIFLNIHKSESSSGRFGAHKEQMNERTLHFAISFSPLIEVYCTTLFCHQLKLNGEKIET